MQSSTSNIPVLPTLHNIKSEAQQKPSGTNTKDFVENNILESHKNITIDEIKISVQAYALQMKAEDRMFEFVLFNERELKYEKGKLTFILENEVQKSQLNESKANFIEYLRKKFESNFLVEAEVIQKSNDNKKLLYTPTDKYKFLAEKYPALEELKKRLGLELDF